jgi:hypothetical protein
MRSSRDARIFSNEVIQERCGKSIDIDSILLSTGSSRAWYAMRLCLQAHERKNDVRQGEERERDTGQFAEHTVLRDAVRGDSLGLLLHLLKACESLINRGSSHFRYLPFQIVDWGRARPMPMTEANVLFNYFK